MTSTKYLGIVPMEAIEELRLTVFRLFEKIEGKVP